MLLWMELMMLELCRIFGTAMTIIGVAGLLPFLGHGLVRATEYIIDKEDFNHDDD